MVSDKGERASRALARSLMLRSRVSAMPRLCSSGLHDGEHGFETATLPA
jgi:hypothetical protein